MLNSFRSLLMLGSVLVCGLHACAAEPVSQAEQFEYFERKIRPLLSQHCFECHSSQSKTVHAGLRLDSAQAIADGGDSGPVLIAGNPDESLLIQTIRYEDDIQMPPQGALAEHEIAELTNWVRLGAAFPPSVEPTNNGPAGIDFQRGRTFWSFQPIEVQPLPKLDDDRWTRTRTDAFILAAMRQQGLTPSPTADRTTLIRRLSFDLTGLPPTPQQVDAFVHDSRSDAYERLLDQFLESPQYGEKWARWWLDMARYTDRTASWLPQTGQAFLYRDWVVKAFNDDLPYDQFVHRQLATDLMPQTGPEDLPALGFISLSPTYWKEPKLPCEIIKVIVADEWEERVDAVSRTFLGLTVACARCHDHKFDPISSEDYYAMAGVFASCRHAERPLIDEQQYQPVREAKEAVAHWEAEIAKLKKEMPPPEEKIAELTAKVAETKAATPQFDTLLANALVEESTYVVRAGKTPQDGTKFEHRAEPRDLPLFIRGNPNRPGKSVPRRFLTVLSEDPQPYQNGSGRLELAESITTTAAPLAARVLVNRVWLAHFDQGIVDTPSNFGSQGDRPTHPELLDDLAARFVANGWSLKYLHREILRSATWQQSSADDPHRVATDPANRWLSRMNRRRLTFEEFRDAVLFASGIQDATSGGPSLELDAADNNRRTLYATVHRHEMAPTLMVHDFPDPTQHSPTRTSTITALQGLYALNGPLLLQHSQSFVQRLDTELPEDDRQRIIRAYRLLFSREPTERELQLGRDFVGSSGKRWQQYLHVLFASNEFVFVD